MDDKGDEFRESVNSLFWKHFLHRRLRRCLSSLLSEPVFFNDEDGVTLQHQLLMDAKLIRDALMEFFPKGATRHRACCDLDQAFHDKNEA